MDDRTLLALCAYCEANLEPDDGLAAIVRVVLNRTFEGYFSDGTINNTVFRHAQFSWTEYAMVNGKYQRVCSTPESQQNRALTLLNQAQGYPHEWERALRIADEVMASTYQGATYDHLTSDTVLYYNPAIVHPAPAWADPAKMVTQIGHHVFFRA